MASSLVTWLIWRYFTRVIIIRAILVVWRRLKVIGPNLKSVKSFVTHYGSKNSELGIEPLGLSSLELTLVFED